MVAIGTLISATWILASNSWMHTPQGIEIINGRVIPVDWIAIIFNPSFPYRLIHMVLAAYLATALIVVSAAAWQILKGNSNIGIRKMLSMGMWMVLIVSPLQAIVGDFHGLNTLKYQPAKIAAIEGHWENVPGKASPLVLFGWPDMVEEKNHFEVAIPNLGSLILRHSWTEQIPALKDFSTADRPNSTIVFWTFRVMVGLGLLMILLSLFSLWARWQKNLYDNKFFLRFALFMGPTGIVAMLAGWYTTEIGRQPWIVYGLMRTADAVTKHSVTELSISLTLFIVIYLTIFGTGVIYLLRLLRIGPKPNESLQGDAFSINKNEVKDFIIAAEFHPPHPMPSERKED
jgi:cytochrome d ubiquinol oxidase subunit I